MAYLEIIACDTKAAQAVAVYTRIELNTDRAWIGRHPDCEFVITLPNVSRRHMCVTRNQGRHILHAHWRKPITFNGHRWCDVVEDIDDGQVELHLGDSFSTCGITFVFHAH